MHWFSSAVKKVLEYKICFCAAVSQFSSLEFEQRPKSCSSTKETRHGEKLQKHRCGSDDSACQINWFHLAFWFWSRNHLMKNAPKKQCCCLSVHSSTVKYPHLRKTWNQKIIEFKTFSVKLLLFKNHSRLQLV